MGPGSGCDSGDPALDTPGINSGSSTTRGGLSQRSAVPSYTSDPYRYKVLKNDLTNFLLEFEYLKP